MKSTKLFIYQDKTFFQILEPQVWQYFTTKYQTKRYFKTNSKLMKVLSLIIPKLTRISKQRFMDFFTTTLGSKIYTAEALTPRKESNAKKEQRAVHSIIVAAHEHVHVLQFRQGRIKFVWRYLTSSLYRALYEAEAYRVNLLLDPKLLGGGLGEATILTRLLNYGCSSSDLKQAHAYLASYATKLGDKGFATKVYNQVIDLIQTQYPVVNLED